MNAEQPPLHGKPVHPVTDETGVFFSGPAPVDAQEKLNRLAKHGRDTNMIVVYMMSEE